jgi:hypothetical protein
MTKHMALGDSPTAIGKPHTVLYHSSTKSREICQFSYITISSRVDGKEQITRANHLYENPVIE